MMLSYSGGFAETVAELADHERAGLDIVWVPEAYSFDAVSQLGFLAARTSRLEIAAGILQIYTRTPTLTAMTAAGLDFVSDGRFTLGLGASNPQVVEGFHGVRYDAPVARTREIVEICRRCGAASASSTTAVTTASRCRAEEGTGLGKPLRLINHPVRERIPIVLAALGPRNVALAAEIAEGWLPILYVPERADALWGAALAEGRARRDPTLGPLDVVASATLCVTDDADVRASRPRRPPPVRGALRGRHGRARPQLLQRRRPRLRLGERGRGRSRTSTWTARRTRRPPRCRTEMLAAMALIGPRGHVAERLAAFAARA